MPERPRRRGKKCECARRGRSSRTARRRSRTSSRSTSKAPSTISSRRSSRECSPAWAGSRASSTATGPSSCWSSSRSGSTSRRKRPWVRGCSISARETGISESRAAPRGTLSTLMNVASAPVPGREAHPRILVIRRDNIGDLVCTTPLIFALRERFPRAHIAALVNTYNEAVLTGNPAVDAVYAYEKGKHRGEKRSIVSVYANRLRLIASLRKEKFDYAIIATSGFAPRSLRLARMIGARHVLGYADPGKAHSRPDIALPYDAS